jgi:hypothetical protein
MECGRVRGRDGKKKIDPESKKEEQAGAARLIAAH